MADLLREVDTPGDARTAERLRDRYRHTLAHGQAVLRARTVVTLFLFLGASAAAGSATARSLGIGETFAQVAAISASLTLVLLLLRLAFDRYLARVDVIATFLAIALSHAPREPISPGS